MFPSLLPRNKAPQCRAPSPPQALITAAVLCPQCQSWGLSTAVAPRRLRQVE